MPVDRLLYAHMLIHKFFRKKGQYLKILANFAVTFVLQ